MTTFPDAFFLLTNYIGLMFPESTEFNYLQRETDLIGFYLRCHEESCWVGKREYGTLYINALVECPESMNS